VNCHALHVPEALKIALVKARFGDHISIGVSMNTRKDVDLIAAILHVILDDTGEVRLTNAAC
jgi:thiamine monophosphate synthase